LANRLIIQYLWVLVIILVFSSCDREYEILNDNVKIIAHRGYHLTKLENTVESFEEAYKSNYKYIEFDINFTKDCQPVILHDNLLDNQSNTIGLVSNIYLSDIQNINLNGGYKIPELNNVLQAFKDKFETFFIDLKGDCSDSCLVNYSNLIKKYNLYSKIITTSSNPEIVLMLKKIDPNMVLGLDGNFEDYLQECIKYKYKHLLVPYIQLDKHLCFIAHANNIKVYAYTANSGQQMLKSLKFEIEGIMSDNPDLLKQYK